MSSSVQPTVSQISAHPHLKLLDNELDKASCLGSVPIITHDIEEKLPKTERPAQYGLLGSNISQSQNSSSQLSSAKQLKSRLFYNVAAPTIVVEELRINQSDLNTRRMLDLMAISSIQGGGMPLYLHVVSRILRDMRIAQQHADCEFDYSSFKRAIGRESLTEGQLLPLQQRLETLESFMVKEQTLQNGASSKGKVASKKKAKVANQGIRWNLTGGQLTIVDLSCPCVTADTACSLFNICLSLFLEQKATIGRVVALDEAHKYMTESSDSHTLTESLLSVIRLQRHLGTRVVLSTQEPTISPKLLDLCSTVIVHRFTSPAWFTTLKRHLAGVSIGSEAEKEARDREIPPGQQRNGVGTSHWQLDIRNEDLFSHIVGLKTGEALLFCPSALVDVGTLNSSDLESSFVQLGSSTMKVRIRKRITADGGKSIMAD
ncbi:P-loop containing protein [Fusarium heterosporum]|uniref:P-loop containing protein n=1 Tax=Fusarium heterosporum TaxID=42747 RepID=A0A8H5X271_FUSHE|nr:P-loop containing protein [Fusarium heterosporum]